MCFPSSPLRKHPEAMSRACRRSLAAGRAWLRVASSLANAAIAALRVVYIAVGRRAGREVVAAWRASTATAYRAPMRSGGVRMNDAAMGP